MQIMTILGSPRREGNTAKVLGWIEDELRAIGHEVDHIFMLDFNVGGCHEYEDGVLTDLSPYLPATLRDHFNPLAINDLGQIIGNSQDSAGVNHAILLTPVPEPSAILLLVSAGAGLLVYKRAVGRR